MALRRYLCFPVTPPRPGTQFVVDPTVFPLLVGGSCVELAVPFVGRLVVLPVPFASVVPACCPIVELLPDPVVEFAPGVPFAPPVFVELSVVLPVGPVAPVVFVPGGSTGVVN